MGEHQRINQTGQSAAASHCEVLSAQGPLLEAAVIRAAALLKNGDLVALPTETVYGLAANATDEKAVRAIFAAKGRPPTNPVIVHVADLAMARACVREWPPIADQLAAAFWPGPLTLVLPKASRIPEVVTAGGTTVGIRWPRHPVMEAVIRRCGFPLAAPSADRSCEISPTCAEHVARSLGGRISLILDGGTSAVGIESTVLDLSVSPPALLRPGIIHRESLLAVVGSLAATKLGGEGPMKSPGQLSRHYAPKTMLVVGRWENETDLKRQIGSLGRAPEETHVIAHTAFPAEADYASRALLPRQAESYAAVIYSELHRCDNAEGKLIMVETLPETPSWEALRDRLQRASSGN